MATESGKLSAVWWFLEKRQDDGGVEFSAFFLSWRDLWILIQIQSSSGPLFREGDVASDGERIQAD